MHIDDHFNEIKKNLALKLSFLNDKPEETIDSTIKACWHLASGNPMSATKASDQPLPELTKMQIATLDQLIEKRISQVPLAHITGRQNFMGIEFLSDERALIPRKETELLGRKALEISYTLAKEKEKVRIMDICCGAGNLGLAVAFYNQNTTIVATDLSQEAVNLTDNNISFLNLNHRLKVKQGDLFSAFEKEEYFGTIDVIICNPPYISSAKVAKMDAEIADHEPALAFDGGMFGTKIIQRLIMEAPRFLTDAGWLVFEVGVGQGEFIMRLCQGSGNFKNIEPILDEIGNIRVIAVQNK